MIAPLVSANYTCIELILTGVGGGHSGKKAMLFFVCSGRKKYAETTFKINEKRKTFFRVTYVLQRYTDTMAYANLHTRAPTKSQMRRSVKREIIRHMENSQNLFPLDVPKIEKCFEGYTPKMCGLCFSITP